MIKSFLLTVSLAVGIITVYENQHDEVISMLGIVLTVASFVWLVKSIVATTERLTYEGMN